MLVKNILRLAIAAPLFGFSLAASAGLVLETYGSGVATPDTLGSYAMTDIASTFAVDCAGYCTADSVALPASLQGSIEFIDHSESALTMHRSTADNTDWWVNGENQDYDIYTTSVNWVELVLPENTRAFSFNVGASFNGWGWMVGFNGGQQNQQEIYTTFNVGTTNTPGFGVYADNSNGECGSISSIIIDPSHWGFGNLSINQSECTASVPEPGVMSLLGIGLLGLGLARTKYSV